MTTSPALDPIPADASPVSAPTGDSPPTGSSSRQRPKPRQSPGSGPVPDLHPLIADGTGWSPRTWLLLVVLGGVLFLDSLDLSMIGVALPDIRAALDMSPSTAQWLVSAYILGYGGLLLLGGRAADLLGRRRVFLAAVLVFGLASVVGAFLSDPSTLIALRFIKGLAAAFTVPAGLSIITTTFAEGAARNRAFSIYTVCGASGFSLGLVAGGVLTEISWRAALFFPGPVALLLFVVGTSVIATTKNDPFSFAKFDLFGAMTSTAALLLLVFTVVRAPDAGWGSAETLGGFVLVALLFAAFIAIERSHAHPLIRLGILRSKSLVHANLAGFAMFGGYASFQFLVTLYVQEQLGWSALSMALAFLPAGLIVLCSAPFMGRVLNLVPTSTLIALGLAAFVLAYGWFTLAEPGQNYFRFMFPTIVLLGIGFGLLFPAVNAQATAGVEDHEQGLASGLLNTFIQVGGALLIAVATAITAAATKSAEGGAGADPSSLPPGMVAAVAVASGLTFVALVWTLALAAHGRRGNLPRLVDA